MTGGFEPAILAAIRARAGRFGLDGATIRAERILNWGSFDRHSFRVEDGTRAIFIKLAADPADLRRWWGVHRELERDYRAPRVLGWVDIPGTPLGGLAFEHLAGATWDPAADPARVGDLLALLGRLHADDALAARLDPGPGTYRDCWDRRHRDRLAAHLATIRACRPALVTADRLAWMEREAQVVLALPAGDPAFAGVARSACHGDLWAGNVLVGPGGAWWVLDWDGLAVGDPAEDCATPLWPLAARPGRDWREWFPAGDSGAFGVRLDRHLRAIGLDYLLAVLVDWAECPATEWRAAVRPVKEAQHREFTDLYRSRYG